MKTVLFASAMLIACSGGLPQAQYIRAVDCQYHVLDNFLQKNDALIDRVLSAALTVDEFVAVAIELKKNDAEIIAAGKELAKCLPTSEQEAVVAQLERRLVLARSEEQITKL